MRYLIDFFEEMDELIYISKPDTYELVYMNRRLRECLGYHFHEEYRGKKCYEVLQGNMFPCAFCTNEVLEQGKVLSWTHMNPVLNHKYLIKDSLYIHEGKKYRIEIAIELELNSELNVTPFYTRNEMIMNECMQQILSSMNPEESLERMLAYIGTAFLCDRVYVFEIDKGVADNTYEWCRQGVTRQKEILQKVPVTSIEWWIHLFQENQVVVIRNLEEIRTKYPSIYAILKPQNITRLVAGPIVIEDQVVGFVGVDNPKEDSIEMLTSLMRAISFFIITLLKRRDLLKRLNTLSFQDTLTGAYNRNAMFEQCVFSDESSVGVIYCDITGLKKNNDILGHGAGDQMIRHCYNLIRDTLDIPWIYRAGGDEFIAVFRNVEQAVFLKKVRRLHAKVQQNKYHIAIGYEWTNEPPYNLERIIARADKVMYEDKRDYYLANIREPEPEQREKGIQGTTSTKDSISLFNNFLRNTYHDMEMFFQSLSQQNTTSYFYFGDMQKDLFYISDNMRDEFGFSSNVVPGLLQEWAQRIPSNKDKDLYWEELNSMLREKRTVHDLRYQVRSSNGKNMWIRCYGILKWDDEKRIPLFFSGRVTHQDNNFVVDPNTNFPRSSVMLSYMDEIRQKGKKVRAIGFCLNNIREINSTRGRGYSDHLVQNVAESLTQNLADKMSFFRLEGMRCAAIVDPACEEEVKDLIAQIRVIIAEWYQFMGIAVRNVCSFVVMEYPQAQMTPSEFLDQMVSLLRVAKHDTSQTYVVYSEKNVGKIKKMSNMALALNRDVMRGMEHFRIVLQPVVSSKDGSIVGGEVLLRWKFQEEDVPPAVFVPMLEKENMIQQVGRWVFEQTVCTCMRMLSYRPAFYLAFNVSLLQMTDVLFPDFMEEMLVKYQLDGKYLVAEMTESCIDGQPDKLVHFVNTCSRLGIRIALDDFGSGYSSLRMLLQYPSSIIKLDQSLLVEMTASEDKMNFISSIVYACHRFGKKVCMEGVETSEQDRMIKESGCDMIQGYYYYQPKEIEEIYSILVSPTSDKKKNEKDKNL